MQFMEIKLHAICLLVTFLVFSKEFSNEFSKLNQSKWQVYHISSILGGMYFNLELLILIFCSINLIIISLEINICLTYRFLLDIVPC